MPVFPLAPRCVADNDVFSHFNFELELLLLQGCFPSLVSVAKKISLSSLARRRVFTTATVTLASANKLTSAPVTNFEPWAWDQTVIGCSVCASWVARRIVEFIADHGRVLSRSTRYLHRLHKASHPSASFLPHMVSSFLNSRQKLHDLGPPPLESPTTNKHLIANLGIFRPKP